jgi:DegV family protein with EDD domain
VPYYIHRGEEVLRDLVTVQCEAFYRWLPTAQELPKTAAPGPGDYLDLYRRIVNDGVEEIASIHMTSLGSGAYQAAVAAKELLAEDFPDVSVVVIDTQNVAMCHGWMVIEAARAARSGLGLNEIRTLVRRMIPITRMVQTADTLKYLFMGGRIGRARHLAGSLLNIKPLIGMQAGVIVPLGQARSRSKAYQKMVDLVEAHVGPGAQIKVAYLHAAALDQAQRLRALVEPCFSCVESLFAELSPALGVHTGPGTAGLCYFPVESGGQTG